MSIEVVDYQSTKSTVERKEESNLYLKQLKKFLLSRFKNNNYSHMKLFLGSNENKEIKEINHTTEIYIKLPLIEKEIETYFKTSPKIMI